MDYEGMDFKQITAERDRRLALLIGGNAAMILNHIAKPLEDGLTAGQKEAFRQKIIRLMIEDDEACMRNGITSFSKQKS